jgi:AraC-like DNA-binding protein
MLSNGHGDGAVSYGSHTSVRVCDLRWGWTVDAAGAPLELFVFRFTVTALLRACDAPTTELTAAEGLQGHMRTARILTELALAIAEVIATPTRGASHLMRAFLLELGHVYPHLGMERTGTNEQLATWQLLRATEFIRERLAGKATVGEIAGACGLSTSYFSRLFKNTTGMTTHQWIIEQRLDHARSLLVSTAMTLVDIAYACGFADQTHFTRVFSRRMNASPMAWRRQRLCCQKGASPIPSDVREAG